MKIIHYIFTCLVLSSLSGYIYAAQSSLPACIGKHYGGAQISSDGIDLIAPDIAENGSVVSVGIDKIKSIPAGHYVREISFYNEFRQEPVARFFLSRQVRPENLKTRIRLRDSSNLYAVARLDNGQLVGGKSHIKVTTEGCGGGGSVRNVSDAKRVCADK